MNTSEPLAATASGEGQVFTSPGPNSTFVGGPGDDTFYASVAGDTLTGGGGHDAFVLESDPWSPIRITDFTVGLDRLDLSAVLQHYGYAGTDPVADKLVYIASNGSDGAIIRFDRDGEGPNPQWPTTIIELEGVAPSSLTWRRLTDPQPGDAEPPGPPSISLTTTSLAQPEGDAGSTAFSYTVMRTGDTSAAATVAWSVVGSGAAPAAGADFAGGILPSGSLAFAVGETRKTITFEVAGDLIAEGNEGFTLTLTGASGSALGTATASGLIVNDDLPAGAAGEGAFVLFAGQSNTGGWLTTPDQVNAAWEPDPLTFIWDAEAHSWVQLEPGVNTDWAGGGWGPEVGFAIAFRAAYPDEPLYIVKNAIGATDLANRWNPDAGDLFAQTTAMVDEAGAALGGRRPEALFWGQGEADGEVLATAQAYRDNLADFFSAARDQWLGSPDAKIAFFQVNTVSPYAGLVRQGQVAVDLADPNAVSFDAAPLEPYPTDPVHYSASGYDAIGARYFDIYAGWQEAPRIGFSTVSVVHDEGSAGGATYSYVVSRTGDLAASASVQWSVAGTGAEAAGAQDFAGGAFPSGVVAFAAGESSKTISFTVADDAAVESIERFEVVLANPTGAILGTAKAQGVIVDDDGQSAPPAGAAGAAHGSNGSGAIVGGWGDDTLTTGSAQETLTGGAGADVFVFQPGATSPDRIADFTPGQDKLDLRALLPTGYAGDPLLERYVVVESDGAGSAQVYVDPDGLGPQHYSAINLVKLVGVTPSAVTRNDLFGYEGPVVGGYNPNVGLPGGGGGEPPPPPPPSLSIGPGSLSLAEGDTGVVRFNFTVTRSGDASAAASVNWSAAGSGANPASAADVLGGAWPEGVLTFAAGETSKTITIEIAGDTVAEADETFTVSLSGASGATITNASAQGVITDDDAATEPPPPGGQVLTSPGPGASLAGGAGDDTLTASQGLDTLTGGAGADVFRLSVEPWAPIRITDFALGEDRLDLSALFQQFGYAGSDPVADKWLYIASNGAGGAIVRFDRDGAGGNPQWPNTIVELPNLPAANLTWTDLQGGGTGGDPPAPTVSLATTSLTLAEGSSGSTTFSYVVTRAGDTAGVSTVKWSVAGAGAAPASAGDFVGGVLPSGQLSFAAGETSKTIEIAVAGDGVAEEDEGFTLTLSEPSGARLATAAAQGVITNDDGAVEPPPAGSGQVLTSPGPGSSLAGGAGGDTLKASQGADTLTGGAGADVFYFGTEPWAPIHITDFTVGTDRIDISALLQASGYAGADPIADRYVFLESDGAGGTMLRFDRDGAGGNPQWPNSIIDLKGVAPGALTWAKLQGGGAPTDHQPATAPDSDSIALGAVEPATGNVITDRSPGDAGDADEGADSAGGDGPLTIVALRTAHTADTDPDGGFVLQGRFGVLTMQANGDYSYSLTSTGEAGASDVFGYEVRDADGDTAVGTLTIAITQPAPDEGEGRALTSPGPFSTLVGGSGNDTLTASQGFDQLTGGAGADLFVLPVEPWGPIKITDFTPGSDKIDLRALFDAAGYTGEDPIGDGYMFVAGNGAGGSILRFDRDAEATVQQWPNTIVELPTVAPAQVSSTDWIVQ